MTNYLANAVANAALRNQSYSSPANVYASLYSTAPTASTSGTEIVGNGYSRQLATFGAPTAGAVSSNATVTFSCTGNNWPTVVAFGITDASTAGNILFFQNIAARNIKVDDDFLIDSGNLTITIS
jgi:hypothetical protein